MGLDSNNNIQFLANQNIIIDGKLLSDLGGVGSGNAGNITLISKHGGIDTRLGELISITPSGFGGDVIIEAPGDIYLGNIKAASHFNNEDNNFNGKLFSSINIKSTGGSVYLNGSNLDTTNTGSGYAGDINITANKEIRLENSTSISSIGNVGRINIGASEYADLSPSKVTIVDSHLNTDNPGSEGIAGNINIEGINEILIANSSIFSGATLSESVANAGNIFIHSIGPVSITNGSQIYSDVLHGGSGNAGNIDIDAGAISLQDSTLITDNNGYGMAGVVNINARHQDVLIENSHISSESYSSSVNYDNPDLSFLPGSIQIAAEQGSVMVNQSRLSTTNAGGGYAGDIIINALHEVFLLKNSNVDDTLGNGIFSNGNLGNIFIGYYYEDIVTVPKKVIVEHSFLTTKNNIDNADSADVINKDAGDVIIKSLGELILNSSNLETATYGTGNGGSIQIEANSVSLMNKSSLLANTLDTGKAGSVTVKTTGGSVSLSESSINTGSDRIDNDDVSNTQGQGGGGDININTNALFLTNNSILNASTFGAADSGNVYITADETISFTDNSIINARTYLSGNAGNVNITTDNLSFSNQSLIQAETFGSGNAGDLEITARFFSLSNTSKLDAQTFGSGNAGNVD